MSLYQNESVLAEVGVFELPKLQGKYDTGQLFLHRVFGYRGVVLFPWVGKIFDRDIATKHEDVKAADEFGMSGSREVKGKTHTYYQVLIDGRDIPHIRVGTESVTFLSSQENSGTLYSIPGLDYVGHEDALPYSTTEKQPIHNHLFDKFIGQESETGPYVARDTLREWQDKNHPWLELTDVHRETTENIRVTVMPFFIGSRTASILDMPIIRDVYRDRSSYTGLYDILSILNGVHLNEVFEVQQTQVYWWRYCIRLENLGEETVQLRERHWRIFSLSGTLETIRGRGIIGKFREGAEGSTYTATVKIEDSKQYIFKMTSNAPVFGLVDDPVTLVLFDECILNVRRAALSCLEQLIRTKRSDYNMEIQLSMGLDLVSLVEEPVFSKTQPAFQYTSHVSLQAPSGHMWGTFKMEREDGSSFECRIPPFSLESKQEDGSTPHGYVV